MRWRATVAYDGTAYQGFQRQIGETPTIQRALERAVEQISGQTVTVVGAGRTDAGVHATGQVIHFDLDWAHGERALLRAINAHLPQDIALQDLRSAPGFHARFDAQARLYRYRIIAADQRHPLLIHRAWHIWGRLDADGLHQTAALLLGEHDFAAFGHAPSGENTVRRVSVSEWRAEREAAGLLWVYTVEATAFLHHMVRRMVALQVAVAQGRMVLADFEALFRRAVLADSVSIAPPQGLTLEAVRYRD